MLRVLVTGGAGFIGSHLTDRLIEMNTQVIVYDNFDKYYADKEKNIRHHFGNPKFHLVRADILNYKILCRAVKKIDIVFHLAAQLGVRFSMENPVKTNTINTTGTLNVLKSAKKMEVKKVIFASSSSAYGVPQYTPIDEKHSTGPISIYGASKVAAECYCKIYNDSLGVPTAVLRLHSVYGPRQRPDMAIYKWTKAIFEGNPPVIYGDDNQIRDFTYISDTVNGMILAAENEEACGEIFNLGSGTKVTVNETISLLLEIVGKKEIRPVNDPPQLGDVFETYADISKVKRLLGYKPRVPLRSGLEQFIEWYNSIMAKESTTLNTF